MAAIVIIGLLFGFNAHILQANMHMSFHFSFQTINIMAVAIVGALFASITWNNITFIAGEVNTCKEIYPKLSCME